MKTLALVASLVLVVGCGGSKPAASSSAAAATIEPGEATDCAGACARVALCWQRQYGQQDASGDRAECEATCASKPEADQQAYAAAIAAETSCPKILDL